MLPENVAVDVRVRQLRQSCDELARRLREGEQCRAEDFLPTLPIPASEVEAALELIYTEFVVREELGQRPSQADWYARFPQWRERLERLFPIGALLDEDGTMSAPTIAETPTDSDSSRDLKAMGRWVDQYELLEKIGRGGMGVVYKARQTGLNRIVALKMILAGDDADPEELARFRREAEDIAKLQHPHIVQVFAVGEQDGQPFFSMEYVEGGSLSQKIAGKPQPDRQAAQWMETLARAMHYAHERGLVHRDLKPGNVVLTTNGVPKITDFGLAKRLAGSTAQTWSQPVLGTPSYISPEQAAGRSDEISALSDVYALGAILYELLTGRAPFQGGSPWETLDLVQTAEPMSPHRINPLVNRELEAVCLKCLEKRPQQRYASSEALAEDLARWLRGEPTLARPRRWTTRTWRALRRHPIMATAALVLVLVPAVWPVVAYLRDPVRHLERFEHQLRKGDPVTLIGETGPPNWFRLIATDPNARTFPAVDGTFSVEARDLGLVELLPDPQCQRYRFQVEVRHDTAVAEGEGSVGIYFAYSNSISGIVKRRHYFCALSFNDLNCKKEIVPRGFRNLVGLSLQRFPETKNGEQARILTYREYAFKPTGPLRAPVTWYQVSVEVTPGGVKAFWQKASSEDQCIGELSRSELVEIAHRPSVNPMGVELDFAPWGGLGLYVYQGSASFRRAVVEPVGAEIETLLEEHTHE